MDILFKKPCKKFKDQLVLGEINLFVSKNKVYYLSGSNYAHKTTITKILTDMISALSRQMNFPVMNGHDPICQISIP